MSDEAITCSFCGKSQREVRKLIAGPSVYICDACVGLCCDIMEEDGVAVSARGDDGEPARGADVPEAVAAVREALAARVVGHERVRRSLLAALRHHDVYTRAGDDDARGKPPRVLLVGPRGAGKTAICDGICGTMEPFPALRWEMGGAKSRAGERGELTALASAMARWAGAATAGRHAILCFDGVEALDGSPEAARLHRDILQILDGVAPVPHFASGEMMIFATMRFDPAGRDDLDDEDALREALAAGPMLPALLDRFDRVLLLRELGATELRAVLEREGGPLSEAVRVAAGCGIALAFSEGARAAFVAHALRSGSGAWGLRRGVRRVLDEAVLAREDVTRVSLEEADVRAVLPVEG